MRDCVHLCNGISETNFEQDDEPMTKANSKRIANRNSELDPNEAVLRLVDLRFEVGVEIERAKQKAETAVRDRYKAKEAALLARVNPLHQVTVEKRAAYLEAQEGQERGDAEV